MLFCVLASGHLERLIDVSLDQAGEFVQMYPKVHIFEGELDATTL